MKKLLLASAIAALSVSAANAAPTVYGKAFLTLDLVNGDEDVTTTTTTAATATEPSNTTVDKSSADIDGRSQLNSNSSRIGLKGSEALTADTDLVYKLEFGINVDEGDTYVDAGGEREKEKSQQFYSRDTYIGLSNAQYGTLVMGRLTAIDGEVDFANVTQGGVVGGDNVLASIDAPRANNAFAYFSPDYDGMQVMAMYIMDENDDHDTLGRDGFGIGGKYAMGPMNIGATYIRAGDELQATRISGDYALNQAITIGALYQNTDFNSDDNENTFTVSGKMKTATPWEPYAQVDLVANVAGGSDADAMRLVVGSKYMFNKSTIGHVYGGYLNMEAEDSETTAGVTVRDEYDANLYGIGAGIEYKF